MMLCCGIFKSSKTKNETNSASENYKPICSQELKLVQLQILFRHGARTPINFVKGIEPAIYDESLCYDLPETLFDYEIVRNKDNEPAEESVLEADLRSVRLKVYVCLSIRGCYASMLTTVGQRQMFVLGQLIRDGYFEQMAIQHYSHEFFRLRTTQLTRTIYSLRCILAGMFGIEHLNNVGPIHFHVKPLVDEDLFPNKLTCPTLRLVTDLTLTRLGAIQSFRRDKETLLKALNQPLTDIIDFSALRDEIVCREAHGLPLPPELLPHLDIIESNAARTLYAVYSGKTGMSKQRGVKDMGFEVAKLAIGRLIHTILNQMERYINGHCLVKMYLYSAHDTSLTPMLEALGIWDYIWPPFAANIIFELYERERDSNYFVRILYCGRPQILAESTGLLIPFNDFKKLLHRYRLPHFMYASECLSHLSY